MMKKNLILILALFLTIGALADTKIKGKVIDKESKETLPGTTITVPETSIGTVTDINGIFEIIVPDATQSIKVQFVGYTDQLVQLNGRTDLGVIELNTSMQMVDEVQVIAKIAKARETPVAMSSIPVELIAEKLGTQEFPEILKSTPGVYATKQGGGYGDSRINLRGFSSENIGVMINGVPVNDMEWGGIYWSNWAGLSDVTRSMQTQRGLGAAEVAVPSVGGSINIITKSTDAKKGGNIFYAVGNDGYRKEGVTVSTGMMDNGFAVTFSGSHTKGDGYIMGTAFEGWSYFINVAKKINADHRLSFTAFGAPQTHNQRSRYDARKISFWKENKDKYGYKYNAAIGYDANGQLKTSAKNFYHKPQMSLNHFWKIDEKSSLSTALYGSISSGGGYAARGENRSKLYGSDTEYRDFNGFKDYARIEAENAANPNGSDAILTSSNNDHQWYGLLSKYKTKLGSNLDLSTGADLRYYIGEHNNTIVDLLGGKFFIDPDRENSAHANKNERLKEGATVRRNYDGKVLWTGWFGQAEYKQDNLSAFVSAAASNTQYQRVDYFFYDENNQESDKLNFFGWSGKGGANYNFNENHNAFVNGGVFSRAPYFRSVFTSADNSNVYNEDAKNEEVYSAEAGYGFTSSIFSANFNAYYTLWKNKSQTGLVDSQNPDAGSYNMVGINALHKGVELDFKFKPNKMITVRGMLSIGDWKWQDDVETLIFNRDGRAVDSKGNVLTDEQVKNGDQHKVNANISNVHVGDAAQTTAALGVDMKLTKDLKIGADWNYFARLFAKPSKVLDLKGKDTWEVPSYYVFDTNIKYNFKVGDFDMVLSGKVNNIFDATYIADAYGSNADIDQVTVFYGFGRTWSTSLKIKF